MCVCPFCKNEIYISEESLVERLIDDLDNEIVFRGKKEYDYSLESCPYCPEAFMFFSVYLNYEIQFRAFYKDQQHFDELTKFSSELLESEFKLNQNPFQYHLKSIKTMENWEKDGETICKKVILKILSEEAKKIGRISDLNDENLNQLFQKTSEILEKIEGVKWKSSVFEEQIKGAIVAVLYTFVENITILSEVEVEKFYSGKAYSTKKGRIDLLLVQNKKMFVIELKAIHSDYIKKNVKTPTLMQKKINFSTSDAENGKTFLKEKRSIESYAQEAYLQALNYKVGPLMKAFKVTNFHRIGLVFYQKKSVISKTVFGFEKVTKIACNCLESKQGFESQLSLNFLNTMISKYSTLRNTYDSHGMLKLKIESLKKKLAEKEEIIKQSLKK